jgi:replication factor A1
MLATQLNYFIINGEVSKNSIIKLTKYICNTVNERKIVIILGMEVVLAEYDSIIGMTRNLSTFRSAQ